MQDFVHQQYEYSETKIMGFFYEWRLVLFSCNFFIQPTQILRLPVLGGKVTVCPSPALVIIDQPKGFPGFHRHSDRRDTLERWHSQDKGFLMNVTPLKVTKESETNLSKADVFVHQLLFGDIHCVQPCLINLEPLIPKSGTIQSSNLEVFTSPSF